MSPATDQTPAEAHLPSKAGRDRPAVTVVGAGLAGCEIAWQLAEAGVQVHLREMKPHLRTPAQVSDAFAELVCSNSLRSQNPHNAVGLLKEEMARLGSVVLAEAAKHRVMAGDALAVDRELFARGMTARLIQHPNIRVRYGVQGEIPPAHEGPVVLATGPLTAAPLAQALAQHLDGADKQKLGQDGLYFYDAIAPIVAGDSLARAHMFAASRWDKGDGRDYLNCPLDKELYHTLVDFLRQADCYPAHDFEAEKFFGGCQPIEQIAAQGSESLRFGPLKPVGLTCPVRKRWPHAVLQLRAEDKEGRAYNLVGMQTKMRRGAQRAFLNLIPGLRDAEILRYGAMHRNTYVDAPKVLDAHFRLRDLPHVRLAGQIVGVEGYVESAACGLMVALDILAERAGKPLALPPETALGALYHHVRGTHKLPKRAHEPQNVHWGMFPDAPWPGGGRKAGKALQKELRVARARQSLTDWAARQGRPVRPAPAAAQATAAAADPLAAAAAVSTPVP